MHSVQASAKEPTRHKKINPKDSLSDKTANVGRAAWRQHAPVPSAHAALRETSRQYTRLPFLPPACCWKDARLAPQLVALALELHAACEP